jgi:carbon storage regulator CsrA
MLVLTRKVGEKLVVPQCQLTVTILDVTSGRVRLGVTAPAHLVVHRSEVYERIGVWAALNYGEAMMSARILIADTDDYLVATYREHLCRHGAVVSTATTGLACVDRLRDFVPDVLVLDPDILWGGGDGVLAVMHEEPAIRPAFVLLLARRRDRGLLYRISSFRVDDYQAKPLSPERLMGRICTLRSSRSRGTVPVTEAPLNVRGQLHSRCETPSVAKWT